MEKKILIIEDNEQNLYLVKFLLESSGYLADSSITGKDGIKKAVSTKPDLILLDIQLPDIDGFKVLEKLREEKSLEKSQIVVVTSYAMVGDKQKVINAGADGYLEKPINPDTFVDSIKPFLEKNE